MDIAWWVCINGDQKGPLSTPVLKRWFAEGRIPPNALVRPENGPWVLASQCKFRRTSWRDLFNGLVVAAGLLLALELFWFMLTNPTAARWTLGLLVVYVIAAMRIIGFGRAKK